MRWVVAVAVWWMGTATAAGQVTQPSGLIVPRDSMNGEEQLFTFFAGRGEGIDWVSDAHNEPDTFSPLCDFTAALLLHEAGSSLGVGWYNVVPGAASAPAEIYEVVPPGSPVGTTITGATIRGDARYMGGEIGFALVRTPPHFTESRWNTVCDSGPCAATPGPWVLSLSYLSTTTENAWYVAFEDGNTSSSSWDNDGDYNDYVFLFTGLTCAGGGEPCSVDGEMGICRNGLTECASGGGLACVRVNDPAAETCNGADDDCDGAVDDGDGLCGAMEVCSRGRCVGSCIPEFGCPDPSDACEDGLCVDAACVGVTCDEGRACVAGTCVAPCDGVVCPGGSVCRAGTCVDPCAGVTCETGRVCERGVCVADCTCRACGSGRECGGDGRCVEAGCSGVTCGAGEVCMGGACVDACTGAICPPGQACEGGACVDVPGGGTDAGPGGGGTMDGGGGGGGGRSAGGVDTGCGCRVASRKSPGAWWALGLLALVGLRARRRAARW